MLVYAYDTFVFPIKTTTFKELNERDLITEIPYSYIIRYFTKYIVFLYLTSLRFAYTYKTGYFTIKSLNFRSIQK